MYKLLYSFEEALEYFREKTAIRMISWMANPFHFAFLTLQIPLFKPLNNPLGVLPEFGHFSRRFRGVKRQAENKTPVYDRVILNAVL